MAFYLCPNCNQIYWRENLNTSPICPHCRNQVLEPINGRFILRCRQCGLTQSKNALEALDGEDPLHCQSPTCSGSLKVINLGKNRTFNKQKAEDRQHPPVPKRRILHHVKHGNSQNQQTGAIPSNNLQKALRNNLQRNIQNQEFEPFPQNQANLKASITNLNKQTIKEPVSSIKVKDHPGLQENDCLELDGEFYEITAKIGTGGMGSVWKARNHKTKKMVAVKEFYYTRFHDPDSGENFCEKYWNREKKITEMQSHSSESCLHYIGALKLTQFSISEYYIIIEYIGGEMLDVWYNKRYNDLSKLDVKELRMIIKDILMPLTRHMHYVHNIISSNGKGIVHRDLTVQNVMIVKKRYQEEFTPIIIDWGVAKEVTQMYNPKKPYYVSSTPEATGIRNRGTPPEVMAGFEPMAATD
ncbi:MAG: protein kinase domain-containing protein, partial [Promethearchaeota archaeon]